jgi:hypothetical protein
MSQWSDVLSRHKAVPILTVVLVAILGTAAVGQISHNASGQEDGPAYPAPYDASKPDHELKAFDKSHPKCALWTDWHKLCSRTGPSGSTYCRTDPQHPVNPSTPFCAKGMGDYAPAQHMSEAERKSSARFTIKYVERHWTESGKPNGEDAITKRRKYPIFDPNRPFSGRTLAQLEHPYCAVWLIQSDDNQQTQCAEDGRSGMPSCKDPSIRFKVYEKVYPVCIEKIRDRICNREDAEEFNIISDVAGNTYNVPGVAGYRRIDAPVIGYSCPFEVEK